MSNAYAFIQTQEFGAVWPLFCLLNAFSKALIWHKAEEYVLK